MNSDVSSGEKFQKPTGTRNDPRIRMGQTRPGSGATAGNHRTESLLILVFIFQGGMGNASPFSHPFREPGSLMDRRPTIEPPDFAVDTLTSLGLGLTRHGGKNLQPLIPHHFGPSRPDKGKGPVPVKHHLANAGDRDKPGTDFHASPKAREPTHRW